ILLDWIVYLLVPKMLYSNLPIMLHSYLPFTGRFIQIPAKEIENLFNVNNEFATCYYDDSNDILYINTVNGDGAGGYAVLFEIKKGQYNARVVTMPF
ncbi:hypothetical protein, partial [Sphingobacterium siyangense]|uniref:hypothetical protein n=1 Tax=Sphingobacterium siyangense TaxID=459529 RepID=UPI003DA25FC7